MSNRPSRKVTNKLLEAVYEGQFEAETIIRMCLMAMSEEEVAHMVQVNDLEASFLPEDDEWADLAEQDL